MGLVVEEEEEEKEEEKDKEKKRAPFVFFFFSSEYTKRAGLDGRPPPVLLNVGRGDLLAEATVLRALDSGWVRHAVLDVLAHEPLEMSSPLWDRSDVTITPHVSAPSLAKDVVALFVENLSSFTREEPLKFQVDWAKGY